MRAAARALRISHSADFAWTSRDRRPLVSLSRNALRFYPTRKLLSDCAHICGYAAVLRARQCRRGPDRSLHRSRVTRIWRDFWSSLLIAVAARRIAKKGQDAPDRDRPQLKQEIHSAASARCSNGNPNRCQTSTKASASVSIKPSS